VKKFWAMTAILATFGIATAQASTSNNVSITSVTCSASNQCVAYFASGSVAANTTCDRKTGDALRWDASTQAGANMLSVVLAAHLSGRSVIVADKDCIGQSGSTYPQLAWVQMF
jgi:hypothetical protein